MCGCSKNKTNATAQAAATRSASSSRRTLTSVRRSNGRTERYSSRERAERAVAGDPGAKIVD